jgi:hypothetical protein
MPFIGNKPSAVPLTSADITDSIITSAKITDATIVNADIANSTINLTTKVTGSLPVANGGTGLTALGSASQVLKVNSGATALEFGTLSSDFVKLATGTISSSTASISFDGYFTSDYNIYKFFYYDCRPVTNNGSAFSMRFRRSNADVTSSNYKSMIGGGSISSASSEGFAGGGKWNGTSMQLNTTTWWISDTSYSFCGDVTIYNPLGTSLYKTITFNTMSEYEDTYWYGGSGSGTLKDNTNALSGITFLMSSSNISSGKFILYGMKI